MKKLIVGLLTFCVLVSVGGSVTGAVVGSTPHETPMTPLFPWVPAGGYPDSFPFGQCTWWAAYNHRVTWSGNAGDWISNARAQGVPISDPPEVGAIVVYTPGKDYSGYGHVALVTAASPDSYTVSEMNFIGWGKVDTRTIPWPDRHVTGFIPPGVP